MPRYGYFDSDFPEVKVSTTFDRKQFGELELLGVMMHYKETQKNYYERIGEGGSVGTYPVLHKGILYFGAHDRNFYAVSIEGKEVWRFRTKGMILDGCAISGDTVCFGSADKNFYAVDAETGREIWRFQTGAMVNMRPAAHMGRFYASSEDGNLYCLDANTGKVIWRFQTMNGTVQTPLIMDNKIYCGKNDNNFYCLNMEGKLEWKFQAQGVVCAWPASYSNGCVYFGSFDGNLYCLGAATGKVKWIFRNSSPLMAPIVWNGNVYVGSYDYNIHCIDEETGKAKWKFSGKGFSGTGKMQVEDGILYFGSFDNNIYAIDANMGRLVWKFPTNGFVQTVHVYQNSVYAGSWDCNLYCLDAGTGKLIWKFKTSMGTPSPIEPPESGMVTSAEVVWKAPEEEAKKAKQAEMQLSDYADTKNEYAGAGMGDYLGKKKRGYV
jgi:outer membrane protein assembly factor BamB